MLRKTALLTLISLASTAGAQARWLQLTPANAPDVRAGAHVAANLVSMYIFGGNKGAGATNYFNDLHKFDGTSWSTLTANGAAGSPVGRRWGAMTFDHGTGRVILFGGQDATGALLGDTWSFDGTSWTQHTGGTSPSPRRWARMAYDRQQGQVLLFGGRDAVGASNETWAFSGTTWSQLTPSTSPSARGRHALAERADTKEIFLYGGTSGTASPALRDMWKWDGSNWIAVPATGAPYSTGVLTHSMYWDDVRDRFVIFGGYNGFERGGTYEFDGSAWVERMFTTTPPVRSAPMMAYLPVFQKAILFSGYSGPVRRQLNDTWEYQTTAPATVRSAGAGCAGVTKTPTLTAQGLPWIDDTFTLQLADLDAGANPMMIIGLSKTTWSGNALPLNLGVIGYSSCNLLVSMDLIVGGLTGLPVPVPNDSALIGIEIYFQGAGLGPASALSTTSRLEVQIGAR